MSDQPSVLTDAERAMVEQAGKDPADYVALPVIFQMIKAPAQMVEVADPSSPTGRGKALVVQFAIGLSTSMFKDLDSPIMIPDQARARGILDGVLPAVSARWCMPRDVLSEQGEQMVEVWDHIGEGDLYCEGYRATAKSLIGTRSRLKRIHDNIDGHSGDFSDFLSDLASGPGPLVRDVSGPGHHEYNRGVEAALHDGQHDWPKMERLATCRITTQSGTVQTAPAPGRCPRCGMPGSGRKYCDGIEGAKHPKVRIPT